MNGFSSLILLFFITLITTAITNVFIKSQIEVGDQHPKYGYQNFQNKNELGRILGGTPTYLNEFPSIVSLRSGKTHKCAGVLISPLWVLTAAHCLLTPVDSIQYGVVRRYTNDSTIIAVNKSIRHEYLTLNPKSNDIGVIRLSKSVNFGKFVRSAILPPPYYYLPGGTMAYATGWGATENKDLSKNLLKVKIPVINRKVCKKIFAVDNRNICAGEPGKGPCNGDSGGPLFVNGIVVGLTSYGATGCISSNHRIVVFTRVSYFLNWIRRNTGLNI